MSKNEYEKETKEIKKNNNIVKLEKVSYGSQLRTQTIPSPNNSKNKCASSGTKQPSKDRDMRRLMS